MGIDLSFFFQSSILCLVKKLSLTPIAFNNRERIPAKYTCDGEDINPPFEFKNVPEDARSLVFLVEDPDSPGKTWLHWALYNISPEATGIAEDARPLGSMECVSDFGSLGYGGPCPTTGTHRYSFKLFALDTNLDLSEDANLSEIYEAMGGHIIESDEVVGLYTRE